MNVLRSKVQADSDDRTYQIYPRPVLGRNPTEAAVHDRVLQVTGVDRKYCRKALANNKATGMTLVEVVVALAISSIAVAGIVSGYLFSVTSAEKSALSLAASARATERLEQTHSAKWDLSSWPSVDQLVETNFPDQVVVLDLNGTGKEITYATNMTTISQISKTPPLKEIRVDCVWSFKSGQLVTNSVETCRAPDQ